jgi:hypothetical protein
MRLPALPRRRRALAALSAAATATALGVALPATHGAAPQAAGNASAATAAQVAAERAGQAAAVYRAYPAATPALSAGAQAAATAAASTGTGRNGGGHGARNLPWRAGFDKELLDPSAADLASHNFHLGGYGIFPTRQSTGPLVDGDGSVEHLYARALAVSDKQGHTMLMAALENQGTFTAYKQGAYGIDDIRQQVSRDTGVPLDMIVVNSDHSHAGPDLIGLWGGVPVDYLQYVHDQAVLALDRAYAARVPAQLLVGSDTPVVPDPSVGGYIAGTATPGEDMVHSQFGTDTLTGYDDGAVDTQLRVLQAVDGDGTMLGTLVNYAAHATVMGGGNVQYSADWPAASPAPPRPHWASRWR